MSDTRDAKTFIVIMPRYYGKGNSIAEAFKQCKKAGHRATPKQKALVIITDAPNEAVEVWGDIGVNVRKPDDAIGLKFEMML